MLSIEELKAQNLILLECISGSRAYGLDTDASDVDIKGVFYLPKKYYYGLPKDYIAQVSNQSNDVVYYELGRFIELLLQNNPNMMELLATPSDCILYRHPMMQQVCPEDFVSQLCQQTFAGFANSQIKKARGLNKKIVNPMSKDKKDILAFCYVLEAQKSIPLITWLEKNNLTQAQLGLAKVPHTTQLYALYVDAYGEYGFCGIKQSINSTQVALSSIPKNLPMTAYLSFNQMGYSKYCQDYADYWAWVENRNELRYQSTIAHGKQYDAKNMMHTIRLLQMALDIATTGKVIVKRNNRDELLAIKSGKMAYDDLLLWAETLTKQIHQAFTTSTLPQTPNYTNAMTILYQLRCRLYG